MVEDVPLLYLVSVCGMPIDLLKSQSSIRHTEGTFDNTRCHCDVRGDGCGCGLKIRKLRLFPDSLPEPHPRDFSNL